MTILIIHGIGGHAGIHWEQWLKNQLEPSHKILMPTLPESNHPDRALWLHTIQELVKDEDKNSLILIGHSLGVTTALDYIEQLDEPIAGFVGVSGFVSDYGAKFNGYFLQEKTIDFDKVRHNVNKSVVVFGDDDPYVTQDALKEVADKLYVEPTIVKAGGHLNTETGFTEFPLLLELIQTDIMSFYT